MTSILKLVDDVLEEASAARHKAASETEAVKLASAQPRSDIARGLGALAMSMRADDNALTYDDLGGLR